jgi:hypothetical protein
MPAKFNADILSRLAEATPEELSAALSAIQEDFSAHQGQPATQDSRDSVVALRDAALAIKGEQTRRTGLQADQDSALSELGTFFADDSASAEAATDPSAGTETTPNQPGTEVQEAVEGEHGTGDADQLSAPDAPEGDGNQEGDDSVTASGRRPLGGTHRAPATARPALPRVSHRTTASAGLDNVSPGATMDRQTLLQAFHNRVRGVKNVPGYERYPVATVRADFPEQRMLTASADPFVNMDKVDSVVRDARSTPASSRLQSGQNSLVAAGFCAPFETLYDIRTLGDTERPVRDALVRFGADRGGIQYRPALDGVTQTGGIGFWTAAQDEADPIVPKTCVEIDCPGVVTAEVEAIYACLTFSNMSTRFDPEFYDSVVRANDIASARISENRLLTLLTAASKNLYSNQLLGATRDILATLDKVIAYYRNVHRLSNEVALRWIAPLWAQYMIRADITRQMVGDGMQALAVTDAQIAQWFAARNVTPTWHLDGIDPADITLPDPDVVVPAQFYTVALTNTAVPDFPAAVSSLLFAEGDWLHLDGGTLDLGVVRDSTLVGQNRFQTFTERFEYPAFRGIESLHLVMPAQPTGASAATVDVSAAAA